MIIGITAYHEQRLRLQTPVHDARALARLLEEEHGYEVVLRCDDEATLARLEALFERELPERIEEPHHVLVYFAGHGVAINSIENPRGYLVPADGGDDPESLLPMERLGRALDRLACRHLLLLLDCCFSGAFRWAMGRDVIAPHVPEMYRQRYELYLATPAWQVITSAAYDERASDLIAGMGIHRQDRPEDAHSPFFDALCEGLAGEADLAHRAGVRRGDGVITATDLYLYLRQSLERPSMGAGQTPQLWLLPRHQKGEYIFHVPGRALELLDAGPLSRETSPYRGFEVYRPEHAHLFFGRRAATERLVAQVEQQTITIVVGGSGTGKSSLVGAGLIPALKRRHEGWQILKPSRAGMEPLVALDEARRASGAGEVVLVLDHIEELFATPERADERRRFLDALAAIKPEDGVRVVGTLRSDLETELWTSSLGERWQEIRFPLSDMNRDELREAIELPAESKVLTFHPPDMVDRLIDTVVSMPGALPLLSFTLDKLYLDCIKRANGDRRLVEDNRLDAGGIALALRDHADAIFERFDEATRDTMRRLLLRLVTVEGSTVTRRQVSLDELAFADAAEDRRVSAVLDALTGKASCGDPEAEAAPRGLRLAILGGDPRRGFVELAHDAILREWPRLKEWRTSAQEDLLLQRALTAVVEQWKRAHKPSGMLWTDDPRLSSVRERLTAELLPEDRAAPPLASRHQLNRLEAEFITRSRKRRRGRRLFVWSLLLVMTLMTGYAFERARSIRGAEERAEISARIERAARAAARSRVAGQEHEALVDAIHVLRDAIAAGHPVHATISSAAAEAAGHRRVELPAQDHHILSLACSRDGSRIVTSLSNGTIAVFAGGGARPSPARKPIVMGSAFTADGSEIATGDELGRVERWPLAGGAGPILMGAQPGSIGSIAVSPAGQIVATGGHDGLVRLWSLKGGGGAPLGPAFIRMVTDVAFSADGAWIAASSQDGTARVWSVAERSLVRTTPPEMLRGHIVSITSVDLSPDGARLLTGGMRTKVWLLPSGPERLVMSDEHVLLARFSPDGSELITGGRDGTVLRWDATSLRQIEIAVKHARPLSMVRYCGGTRRVAIADEDGRVFVHHLGHDNAAMVLGSGERPVMALAFAKDDHSVFAGLGRRGAAGGRLERWDLRSGRRMKIDLEGHADLWRLSLTRDGAVLEIETRAEQLLSWDTARDLVMGPPRALGFDAGRVAMLGIASAKRILVNSIPGTSTDDRRLGLALGKHEKRAPETIVSIVEEGPASHLLQTVSSSPAGGLMAIAGLDGTVEVMDVAQSRAIMKLFGHTGVVRAVRFSSDGGLIATAGDDGTARLWDAKTGGALAIFTGHDGPVLAVDFSHDHRRIVTGGHDGTIRVYPVSPQGILALACNRLRGTTAWLRVASHCAPD